MDKWVQIRHPMEILYWKIFSAGREQGRLDHAHAAQRAYMLGYEEGRSVPPILTEKTSDGPDPSTRITMEG